MSESLDHLAARLRRAKTPDRRLDSEVTALAIGLPQARLDDLAGIDGWDIVLPSRRARPAEVWLAAACGGSASSAAKIGADLARQILAELICELAEATPLSSRVA